MGYQNKQRFIPSEWKPAIDDMLQVDLLEQNRNYARTNPDIVERVTALSRFPPEVFYPILVSRWKWHNTFYEDRLDTVMEDILQASYDELSPYQVLAILDIYRTMVLVDKATIIASGAIKPHLDYWIDIYSHFLRDDEMSMLMTPPEDTFFVKYMVDHLYYIILQKKGREVEQDAERYKLYLLSQYHINDDSIFEGRLRRFSRYADLDISEIEKMMGELKISENYKVKHLYFRLERRRIQAIVNTLIYDNVTEYLYLKQLVGISGFVLRKKIIEYIASANIADCRGCGIFDIPDDIVIERINQLYDMSLKRYSKKVEHYRQTGNTCVIACYLMTLKYFKLIDKVDVKMEHDLYLRLRSKYIEGVDLSAIAVELAKAGMEVRLYHSEESLFRNNHEFEDHLFSLLLEEYSQYLHEAQRLGTESANGVTVDSALIRKLLEDGHIIIAAGQAGGILHSITITGYDLDSFIINNPLDNGKSRVRTEQLENFLETSIGRWILATRRNSKGLSNLLDQTLTFRQEAGDLIANGNIDVFGI